MTCTVVNNVITLFDPFSIPYTPNASNPLNFNLPNVLMPFSVKPTSNLTIETFIIRNSTLYSVDKQILSNTFTATVGPIYEATVTLENSTTYTNTTYLFSLRPFDSIPPGGWLEILFPAQVSILNSTTSLASCAQVTGFS